MQITLANYELIPELRSFFGKYIDMSNDGVYSQEFICPDGMSAATRRGQMMIAIDGNEVIGACRFYKRKTNDVSLYQFAIEEKYRGTGLLIKMLEKTEASGVTVRCPENAKFNQYYRKTGWTILKTDKGFIQWGYPLCNEARARLVSHTAAEDCGMKQQKR